MCADLPMLRVVLDATRLLILGVDNEGLVRVTNQAVEQATGLSHEACVQPIWEFAALLGERALLQAAFSSFKADALPFSLVFHLVSRATPSRIVDWDIRTLENGNRGPTVI